MHKSASLSTAEEEWYAASEAGKEIIGLHSILFDFGFEEDGTTKLHKDSRVVIVMTDNPVNREGSRHIDTRKHFIGALVQEKIIESTPCATDQQTSIKRRFSTFPAATKGSAF
jgi:hypothetical protein